jgi:hypothetical protein
MSGSSLLVSQVCRSARAGLELGNDAVIPAERYL